MNWNGLPVVIFGTGAMSNEAERILRRINARNYCPVFDFKGYVDKTNDALIICRDDGFAAYAQAFPLLGAVIPFSDAVLKEKIYSHIKDIPNLVFPNIIDPAALLFCPDNFIMGMGNIIEPGAVVNSRVRVGNFNLINIHTTIGHDCIIGNYCSIQPNAVLSGNVTLNDRVLIGAGAVLKQGLTVGENAILGLGAFAVKDIPASTVMVCEPARKLK